MKDITYIITGMGVGGAEKQVSLLADSLMSHKSFKVQIISLTNIKGVYPASKDIELHFLNITKNPISFINGYCKAKKILKKSPKHIVHSHMFHANIFARLLRLSLPMNRLICSAHSSNEGGFLRMLLYRITDFLCDITTNVSYAASEALIEKKAFKKSKNLTIYNCVDVHFYKFNLEKRKAIRKEFSVLNDERIIINVARFEDVKDHRNLLEGFAKIYKKNKRFKLFLIGDGSLRSELQGLVSFHELDDVVFFLGKRQNVPDFLSAADYFVLSSKYEGFSLVVAESMACECITISTLCEGPPEIISNTGNVLIPKSSPSDIELAIDALEYFSEDQKNQIRKKSRDRIVNNFSVDNIIKQWIQLYS